MWVAYSRLVALKHSLGLSLSFPTGGTPPNIPHQSHLLLQLPEDDRGTRPLFLSSLSTSLRQARLPAVKANGDHHELHILSDSGILNILYLEQFVFCDLFIFCHGLELLV